MGVKGDITAFLGILILLLITCFTHSRFTKSNIQHSQNIAAFYFNFMVKLNKNSPIHFSQQVRNRRFYPHTFNILHIFQRLHTKKIICANCTDTTYLMFTSLGQENSSVFKDCETNLFYFKVPVLYMIFWWIMRKKTFLDGL